MGIMGLLESFMYVSFGVSASPKVKTSGPSFDVGLIEIEEDYRISMKIISKVSFSVS